MFQGCNSLNFIPAFTTTAITTDYTTFATGSSSLNRILMSFNRTVALLNCQLSKDALVEIFTNLTNRTATTSATIDITGNWGASALTASDRLIATNKNWVITG
jgi:hypothetical protein